MNKTSKHKEIYPNGKALYSDHRMRLKRARLPVGLTWSKRTAEYKRELEELATKQLTAPTS